VTQVVHVPYVVEQDEDGVWCASALLRSGVGAVGDGATPEEAVADLRAGLEALLEVVGAPSELTLTVKIARPLSASPTESAEGVSVSRRIDFCDDPEAPAANSLVPSVNVVVVNAEGSILMIRRTDNGNWALPGGAIDLGESVVQAAVRETLEETGIECEVMGIVGIYSDPRHVILYTSNGEVRQEFSIVLTARALGGRPTPSSESSEVRWVPAAEAVGYAIDRPMRIRINDFLARKESPVVT
jgi:8-oxo-dGTP pyrophosphatase MutT (NUDIX family)